MQFAVESQTLHFIMQPMSLPRSKHRMGCPMTRIDIEHSLMPLAFPVRGLAAAVFRLIDYPSFVRMSYPCQYFNYSTCGISIAIRIVDRRHRCAFGRILQQLGQTLDNSLLLYAHQHGVASRDSLRAFSRLAHHQYRLAQRGRFFLHAARIGENDRRIDPSARQTARRTVARSDGCAGVHPRCDSPVRGRSD